MSNTNLRIWDAVSKTDPSHTKPVEFGSRKFTSIDAHWQVMQATKQFGPVGVGWGYTVDHSFERLTDTMVLAVADVTLWYREDEKAAQYGPIRGTCEVYGPKTYKGKAIPGEFVTDEDAPKKAMTDALTKGLSHLGFSADVFLKLFDDNRYVQRLKREFANGGASAEPEHPLPPEDRHLMTNGSDDTRSQYEVDKVKKAVENEWRVVNKTPKGQEDQIFAYLNLARNPDDAAKISGNNAELIAAAPWREEFAVELDKLLRYFERASAPTLQ